MSMAPTQIHLAVSMPKATGSDCKRHTPSEINLRKSQRC